MPFPAGTTTPLQHRPQVVELQPHAIVHRLFASVGVKQEQYKLAPRLGHGKGFAHRVLAAFRIAESESEAPHDSERRSEAAGVPGVSSNRS